MTDNLVIIGANEFQNRLIIKANEKGFNTHVFAWPEGAVGKINATKFYPISITEKEKILEVCKSINPKGVISVASDLAVPTVNYITEALKLNGNPTSTSADTTNKFAMRNKFYQHGIPCPKAILVDKDLTRIEKEIEKLKFPLIVKPTDRSGSRAVEKVHNLFQLKKAALDAIASSFEKKAIVEEYMGGDEYSIEAVSFQGDHHILAITQKYTTGEPHFIETAHLQPATMRGTLIDKVYQIIPKALKVLGIKNGASHSEIKIDENGNVKIIEIGARMGGDCIGSDLVSISTGNDFLSMVIDIACGKAPSFNPIENGNRTAWIKFIFSESDLALLNKIKKTAPGAIHRVSEIEQLDDRKIEDSSNRFGYFILNCDDIQELERLISLGMTE